MLITMNAMDLFLGAGVMYLSGAVTGSIWVYKKWKASKTA